MISLGFLKDYWPHLTFFIASATGLYKWRKGELRHNDVLDWSNRCIAVSQTTHLVMCRNLDVPTSEQHSDQQKIKELSIEASVLVEQGRLLFKNVEGKGSLKGYGRDKSPAYRGIRPKILDWVLLIHEAAQAWENADVSRRRSILLAVEDAERNFVSLAQFEVGRSRTAHFKTSEPGDGSPLALSLSKQRAPIRSTRGQGGQD